MRPFEKTFFERCGLWNLKICTGSKVLEYTLTAEKIFLSIYSTETEKKKVNLSMYQKVVENC